MNILLDHCVPKRLRKLFAGHHVKTAGEMGWDKLRNGDLLALAAEEFDVILTVDRNIRHQQDPDHLPMTVIVLMAQSNRLADLLPLVAAVEKLLENLPPTTLVEVSVPSP